MVFEILRKKVPEKQELTTEQAADLKFVEKFYEDGIRRRRPYEYQWLVNMAYFLDKQWLKWNRWTRSLEKPMVPSYRVHQTVNKIKPNVLHILAKLVKNKPTYIAMPATSEDEDRHAAEISWKVLKHLHRNNRMDMLNQRLNLWRIIYGTAFKEPYFDESKGKHIKKEKTETKKRPVFGEDKKTVVGEEDHEEPVTDEGGNQQFYDFNTGEEDVEILSPFAILPEAGATDFKNCQRMMKIVSKPVAYIRNKYEAGKFVSAEPDTARSSIERQLLSLMEERYATSSIVQQQRKDQKSPDEGFATIKEMRELPSKDHPKGRLIRTANGVLLDSGPLPRKYMIKRRTFGIVKYDYIEVAERFWGDTPVTSMIPIQTEFNKTISQATEIRNLMSKPKWIAFKQSKVTQTAITSEPGEVIEVTHVPGVPEPHPIQGMDVPATYPNMLQRGDKDMADVGLVHEVTKGTTPPGVKANVAIQFLAEQDQTVFGPVISRFEEAEGEAGTYELEIVKEKYKEPRLLKIVGADNEIEVFEFMASEDMPTDVIVQSGSSLPQSMVAKQQLVLQYFHEGAMGDPADPKTQRRALRMAEMGELDTFYEEIAADEREAEREHKLWGQGEPTQPMFYNDDAAHAEKHILFCNSDRYRRLIEEFPFMAEVIELHITIHNQQDPAKAMQVKEGQAIEDQAKLDKMLKIKGDRRADIKTADNRAVTTSQILTDVKEREELPKPIKQPIGGT